MAKEDSRRSFALSIAAEAYRYFKSGKSLGWCAEFYELPIKIVYQAIMDSGEVPRAQGKLGFEQLSELQYRLLCGQSPFDVALALGVAASAVRAHSRLKEPQAEDVRMLSRIIDLSAQGLAPVEVSKKLRVSIASVYNNRNKSKDDLMRAIEQRQFAMHTFSLFETVLATKKFLGRVADSAAHIYKRYGVPLTIAGKPINHYAFRHVTPRSLYWAGFLYADGNVSHNSVTLCLKKEDEAHVRKFREFMRTPATLTARTRENAVQVSCTSAIAVQHLRRFGVVPNKSYVGEIPDFLVPSVHFWRGAIDGDGSILIPRSDGGVSPRVDFIGTDQAVSQFCKFASQYYRPEEFSPRFNKKGEAVSVSVSGRPAVRMLYDLYGRFPFVESLPRKHATALAVLERYRTVTGDSMLFSQDLPVDAGHTSVCPTCGAAVYSISVKKRFCSSQCKSKFKYSETT